VTSLFMRDAETPNLNPYGVAVEQHAMHIAT